MTKVFSHVGKITPDTNILIRVVVDDDKPQARAARHLLENAELVALSLPSLCELVWVLRRFYKIGREDVSLAIALLLNADNVTVDRQAVEAGLADLNTGGDFADGVIAHQGRWMGGEVFVSFDKKAVSRIAAQGQPARLLLPT